MRQLTTHDLSNIRGAGKGIIRELYPPSNAGADLVAGGTTGGADVTLPNVASSRGLGTGERAQHAGGLLGGAQRGFGRGL